MANDYFTSQMIAAAGVCCAVALGVWYHGKLLRDDKRERDAEAQAKAARQIH